MSDLFKYKDNGETVEVELTQEKIAEILGDRTALQIHFDKIESILNDPDISDVDFARILKAYFKLRMYGEIPDFSDDRFLRKSFEVLTANDRYMDRKYIERVLQNRANGRKHNGRSHKQAGDDQDEDETSDDDKPNGLDKEPNKPNGSNKNPNGLSENPTGSFKNPIKPNKPDIDNDTDKDNDKGIGIGIEKGSRPSNKEFVEQCKTIAEKLGKHIDDDIIVGLWNEFDRSGKWKDWCRQLQIKIVCAALERS